jgi:hypothetical protein
VPTGTEAVGTGWRDEHEYGEEEEEGGDDEAKVPSNDVHLISAGILNAQSEIRSGTHRESNTGPLSPVLPAPDPDHFLNNRHTREHYTGVEALEVASQLLQREFFQLGWIEIELVLWLVGVGGRGDMY